MTRLLTAALMTAAMLPTVANADVPVPLPGTTPVDVADLRPKSPAVLPMVGTWRFEPTHGSFAAGGRFVGLPVSASSVQLPAELAVDGNRDTRWCAQGGEMPQWWQLDLGTPQQLVGLDLAWEHADGHYKFTVGACDDGHAWKMVADQTGGEGTGDGPVAIKPITARFVRITITAAANAGGEPQWASIREVALRIRRDGREVVWSPPKPAANPAVPPFASASFDDRAWHDIPVPGNWEMYGYSDPTYDHADDAAGLYRRMVDVPASFAGQRVLWHFDAVMDGAEVFVNDKRVGYHEGGFTGWDLDVTDAVHPGRRNLFALRVCKTTPSVSLDSGDFWNLGGISRDTYLKAVPPTHVDDLTLVTPLSPDHVDATLDTTVRVRGTPSKPVGVTAVLYRVDGTKVDGVPPMTAAGTVGGDGTVLLRLSAPVKAPKLWSAEHPNLYYLVCSLDADGRPVEAVQQRFGFRQVEIKDNVLLWNGVPIKLTGTCRHEEWSALGHALDEHAEQTDVAMIKGANINAVRTSHYNHAVRFLELCDEKGLYVLDEIPACFCNPKDLSLRDAFVQHAVESLSRDKNLPCVLAWSCGNESGFGPDFAAMVDYVAATDPTRPRFVSEQSKKTYPKISFNDWHYPDDGAVARMAKSPDGPWVITEGPHTFYGPELAYDPGVGDLWGEVLAKQWSHIWPDPRILGAFIWEWQDQGLLDPYVDPSKKDARGITHENHKGMVDGFRNPKPELYQVKEVYSPVTVEARTVQPQGGACHVTVQNRYAFTDLSDLTCRWRAVGGGAEGDKELSAGELHPACPPGTTADVTVPAPAGTDAVVLEFVHPDGRSIYATRLTVAGAPAPAPPPPAFAASAGTVPQLADAGGQLRVTLPSTTVSVDKTTGRATFALPGGGVMTGPTLNLGEHRVDNGDHGDRRAPAWIESKSAPRMTNAQVTAGAPTAAGVTITVAADVSLAEAPDAVLGRLTYTLDVHADGTTDVAYDLAWSSADANAWEFGLTFDLPSTCDHLSWYHDAQWTAYPPDYIGSVTGRVDAKDVSFRATKRNTIWATLTDAAGHGMAVLQAGTVPLHVRGEPTADGNVLVASTAEYAPRSFSSNYLNQYRIRFQHDSVKHGAFTLRPVGGPTVP
jgi:beta-galactosidase